MAKKLTFPEGFSVRIQHGELELYIALCKEYKINYHKLWKGNAYYYGANKYSSYNCSDKSFGEFKFTSLYEFKKYLSKYITNKIHEVWS